MTRYVIFSSVSADMFCPSCHWIFDDNFELGREANGPSRHKQPYADVATAISRVRSNKIPLNSGQVISELSFGFWHQMASKRQSFLWPDLVAAFRNGPTVTRCSSMTPWHGCGISGTASATTIASGHTISPVVMPISLPSLAISTETSRSDRSPDSLNQ